ncbi:response regulator [Segetibacter aerophilus]|uniref:Chemotaxis protein CheY n=1 Tax=Segetibacter aerophilus TaxID=670293 RepID=A0A512B8G9_9BACT|nr:response regulator [Segetibacter aerophilus]GEO08252.1 chemotaxis protein CheY [Segetibacter aerophilus]
MSEVKRCLIIDDDPDDQEIFMMCVKNLDNSIDCKTSGDGVEAIALLGSDGEVAPDYIFIDVNMPRMNGIECLTEIRKIEKLNDTRIFMYSTTAEEKRVNESKKLGAEDFIVKPIRMSELKEKLRHIFQSSVE